MKKTLPSFSYMFEADTGMDRRDSMVSAWADALEKINGLRSRKFIATDVNNWLNCIMSETKKMDKSKTVDVCMDSSNDLFCVAVTDASGCSEFCVPPPRNPKDSREELVLKVINGGKEAHEAFRDTVLKFCSDDAPPAKTVSDEHEEKVEEDFCDYASDAEIDELSKGLDRTASLVANNQYAAYMIELAASRIRELKNG